VRRGVNQLHASLRSRDLRSFEILFEFESDDPIRIRFESDANRPHIPCAVMLQTTLTHSSTKNINLCAVNFVVEIYVYNSTLHVQLEHIHNSHMTIGIEDVND